MPGEHHDEHEHPLASEATSRQGYLDEAPAHPPELPELPDLHELHDLPIFDDHQLDTLDLHAHAHGHTHAYDTVDTVDPTLRTRLLALAEATLNVIRRHWLAGINALLVTLIGVAVLTPIGYAFGFTGASDAVFHAYRFVCGQTPSHSFYILGYQMCLCTRCLAIYSSLLSGGILLALLRESRRIPSLNWKYWLLAMLPMALDGGTQLFGLRESNLALRLLSGALFGMATAWFLFPQIEEASRGTIAARWYRRK
jgi:uncharacterized membrane protein